MSNKQNKKTVYRFAVDEYKIATSQVNAKKIVIDNQQIGLSVGSQVHFDNEFKSTLLIEILYNNENKETLTEQIPQLESFGNIIAINPEFSNQKVIKKLKELDILSETIDEVSYKQKKYELVKVNLEELKLYKPFGDSVLNDYLSIQRHREREAEKELE